MKRFGGESVAWLGRLTAVTSAGAAVAALAPVVSGIAPGLGSLVGGLAAVVTGSNFQLGASVSIGGAPAIAVVTDAQHIAVVTPALSLGIKDVTVQNPDGQTSGLSGVGIFTVTL